MSTPTDDGGPFHPCTQQVRRNGEVIDIDDIPGASLRDFAEVHFIAALIASPRPPAGAEGYGVSAGDLVRNGRAIAAEWIASRKEQP